MRNTQLRPDAAAILFRVPELERRTPPDYFQSWELPERGDQVLRYPVGEVLLTRLPALIRQRQHRDGGRAPNESLRSRQPLECEIPEREGGGHQSDCPVPHLSARTGEPARAA